MLLAKAPIFDLFVRRVRKDAWFSERSASKKTGLRKESFYSTIGIDRAVFWNT